MEAERKDTIARVECPNTCGVTFVSTCRFYYKHIAGCG
jgi:hypothetical protein